MKKLYMTFILLFISIISFTSVKAAYLNQEDSFNNIVIFIRFSDETDYQAPYSLEHYEDLFNAENQASLRDYYLEVTYGQLTINSYLVTEDSQIIWYTDSRPRSYYEEVPEELQGDKEHELLKNAIDYIDNLNLIPDTLELDANDDGMIDSITFMVSGEDSGWSSLLWPHKWELYSYTDNNNDFTNDAPTINGVHAYTYTFELLGNSTSYDNQVDVGVLAHETFHLLSAPDLYHYYEYPYIGPVGDWGLMDNVGTIPSHMLGYMKYRYGNWITEINTITETGSYTLYPMQDSPDNIYKIYTGHENEFIYLEYRDNDGLYESTLPDSGLLVYRVNESLNGNEYGSYDSDGNPTDEVWVFRPGMDDDIPPIILEDEEGIDGLIDDAALSNNNDYQSAGPTSEILLFNGNGDLVNLNIYNVIEHDGYVTFDVILPPTITLQTTSVLPTENVILYDHEAMDYSVLINNVPEDYNVYFTTDGTDPNMNSTLYDGSEININASNNVIKAAIYDGEQFLSSITKEFYFTDTVESAHNPYGNMLNTYWYLEFSQERAFDVTFHNDSYLEEDYDYLYLIDQSNSYSYTGNELTGTVSFLGDYLLIQFDTDEYVDEYYGFSLDIDIPNDYNFTLIGDKNTTLEYGNTYNELGYSLDTENPNEYRVEILNDNSFDDLGEYTVTYQLYDSQNQLLVTLTRRVEVVDSTSPIVALKGDEKITLVLNSVWEDPGVTYSDNYDDDPTLVVHNSVFFSKIGTFYIAYEVIDSSGNKTVIRRTIEIIDVEKPTLTLNQGVDTLVVGDVWDDTGIIVVDDSKELISYETNSTVNTSIPGSYTVTYTASDSSSNTATITRVVTILEPNNKNITCDPFTATFKNSDNPSIGDCYVDGSKMDKITDANPLVSGIYKVSYTLTIDEVSYHTHQYIYIIGDTNKEVAYIERRKEL